MATGVALALATVGLIVLFLHPYLTEEHAAAFGYDTPKYVWRTNLIELSGLESLDPDAEPFLEHPDRAGYPVLAAGLRTIIGIDASQLTFVFPALGAALVGLSAAAVARRLREPDWSLPVYALIVGGSMQVTLIAGGLLDNLLFDPIALALVAWALLVADDGRTSLLAGAGLVAAATLVHWNLTAVLVLVVLATAAVLALASLGRRRAGGSILRSGPARMATMATVGFGAGMGGMLTATGAPPGVPLPLRTAFLTKLSTFGPLYRLPLTVPAAALGAAALAMLPPDRPRRRGMVLLVIWALVPLPAYFLLMSGRAFPAHRFIGFALAIPLLGAAAVTGLARLLARHLAAAGRVLGAVLAVAVVALVLAWSIDAWDEEESPVTAAQLEQSAWAGAYLEAVGNDGPVVFVVDPQPAGFAVRMAQRIIRAAVPAEQVSHVYLYLGDAEVAMAGQATVRPGGDAFNGMSRLLFREVQEPLAQGAPIVHLATFNRGEPPVEVAAVVAPGVFVVRGPALPGTVPEPDVPTRPSDVALVFAAVAAVLALGGIGAGWAVSFAPPTWLDRTLLAPAMGVSALVVIGVLIDLLGFHLSGPASIAQSVLAAGLGWLPAAIRRVRRSPDTSGDAAVS